MVQYLGQEFVYLWLLFEEKLRFKVFVRNNDLDRVFKPRLSGETPAK